MRSLWEQRVHDLQGAIHRRDAATHSVNHAESLLEHAETELAARHAEFVEARDALFRDFPELETR